MKTKSSLKKLPIAFKEKWVAALRSGKYNQGKHELYSGEDENSYCCLGVACRVAGIPKGAITSVETIPLKKKRVPEMLQGSVEQNPLVKKLTEFNDGNFKSRFKNQSFKWIASYIERYL